MPAHPQLFYHLMAAEGSTVTSHQVTEISTENGKTQIVYTERRKHKQNNCFSEICNTNFIQPIYHFIAVFYQVLGFPGGSEVKASASSVGNPGSIPRQGRSSGEGNGTPLQYSSWKIPWTEKPGRLQSMGSQRVRHD